MTGSPRNARRASAESYLHRGQHRLIAGEQSKFGIAGSQQQSCWRSRRCGTYGPPRLQVIFPMDWSVCVNVSGLRASSRPRWRSARSGSHNSVGDKSAIPHIRFPEHRSTVRPSFFHHPQTSWTGSRSSYQHRSISVTPSHQRLWRQICRRDVRRPTQSVPAYWPMRRLRRSYAPW